MEVPAPRQAAASPTPTPQTHPPFSPSCLVLPAEAPWGSADVALPLAHEERVLGGHLTDVTHASGAPICLLWGPLPLRAPGLGTGIFPAASPTLRQPCWGGDVTCRSV